MSVISVTFGPIWPCFRTAGNNFFRDPAVARCLPTLSYTTAFHTVKLGGLLEYVCESSWECTLIAKVYFLLLSKY